MNRIPATLGDGDVELLGVRRPVAGRAAAGPAVALVRPEALLVAADPPGVERVVTRTFSGAMTRLAVALPDGLEVQVDVASVDSQDLTPGTAVSVTPAERPALVAAAEPGTAEAARGRSVGHVLVLPRAPAVCTRCRDQEHTVGRSVRPGQASHAPLRTVPPVLPAQDAPPADVCSR